MKGKHVVITEGTSKLGYLTALDLATMGARVFISGADEERGRRAEKELRRAAGHDGVHFLSADPGRVTDALRSSAHLESRIARVDVLVHAGEPRRIRYDAALTENVLVRFAWTEALLPLLRAARNARVVNVVANTFGMVKRDPFADMDESGMDENGDDGQERSQLLSLLWTFALARRLLADGIAVNAANPAATYLPAFLACAPEAGDVTGTYFDGGEPFMRHPTMRTLDVEDQERAWALAERGLTVGSLARMPAVRAANWL